MRSENRAVIDRPRAVWLMLLTAASIAIAACGRRPANTIQVAVPDYRADEIAQQAVELYDLDGDGRLSGDEIKACPGIADNVGLFDTDNDGAVSADEIAARVNRWIEGRAGLLYLRAVVALNGVPLPEAQVEFEPEPFLADVVSPASGGSGPDGGVAVSPQGLEIPEPLRGRPVLQPGLYKVRITHPKVAIPAQYNTDTELGCEVSHDTANPSSELVFRLKSRGRPRS